MLINHLLLNQKFYIYITRNIKQLNFGSLRKTFNKIKELAKELAGSNKM